MPDALELPGVLRAVEKLVGRERLAGFRGGVVDELVALALGHAVRRRGRLAGRRPRLVPGFAAVVGALDDLPEPTARLRRVQPVRVHGRAFQVVNLPAGEVGAADVPLLALAVRGQYERALACPHQNPYSTHPFLLTGVPEVVRWRTSRPLVVKTPRAFKLRSGAVSPNFGREGGHAAARRAGKAPTRPVRRG